MSYGKMATPIVINCVRHEKDEDGFARAKEIPIASARAYFETKNSTEKWANSAVLKNATALFRFRYLPEVKLDTSMVIECMGERYNIVSVENIRQKNMYYEVIGKLVETVGKNDSKNA